MDNEMRNELDMENLSETEYAPLDEFLNISGRMCLISGYNKKTASYFLVHALDLILSGLILWQIYKLVDWGKEWKEDWKDVALLFGYLLVLVIIVLLQMKRVLKLHKDMTADPELVNIENILRTDGIETVYEDLTSAKEIGGEHLIGRKYIFFNANTLIRIADITDVDLTSHYIGTSERDYAPFLKIHVKDEMGERCYEEIMLEEHGSDSQEYKTLTAMIEDRRRSLPGTDRPGLSVDI